MKLPIISLAILGGQAMLANQAGGDMLHKLNAFQSLYSGYDFSGGGFVPQNLIAGYGPWIVKRFILPLARPGRSLSKYLPVSLS